MGGGLVFQDLHGSGIEAEMSLLDNRYAGLFGDDPFSGEGFEWHGVLLLLVDYGVLPARVGSF